MYFFVFCLFFLGTFFFFQICEKTRERWREKGRASIRLIKYHWNTNFIHNTYTNLQFEKGVVANLFNGAVARRMGRPAGCGICSCIDNKLITKVKTAIGLDRCRLLISGECVRLCVRMRLCVCVYGCWWVGAGWLGGWVAGWVDRRVGVRVCVYVCVCVCWCWCTCVRVCV